MTQARTQPLAASKSPEFADVRTSPRSSGSVGYRSVRRPRRCKQCKQWPLGLTGTVPSGLSVCRCVCVREVWYRWKVQGRWLGASVGKGPDAGILLPTRPLLLIILIFWATRSRGLAGSLAIPGGLLCVQILVLVTQYMRLGSAQGCSYPVVGDVYYHFPYSRGEHGEVQDLVEAGHVL